MLRKCPVDETQALITCASMQQALDIADGKEKGLTEKCKSLIANDIKEHVTRKGVVITRYNANTDGPFHDRKRADQQLRSAATKAKKREANKAKEETEKAAATEVTGDEKPLAKQAPARKCSVSAEKPRARKATETQTPVPKRAR